MDQIPPFDKIVLSVGKIRFYNAGAIVYWVGECRPGCDCVDDWVVRNNGSSGLQWKKIKAGFEASNDDRVEMRLVYGDSEYPPSCYFAGRAHPSQP